MNATPTTGVPAELLRLPRRPPCVSYRNPAQSSATARAVAFAAKLLFVLLAWLAATAAGLYVVATTTIGPVVLSLSATHGVHVGDLLAFGLFYAAATMVTVIVLAPRR